MLYLTKRRDGERILMKGGDRMKWFLVKAGCIIGAGVIAAVLWGDILAGVLIAPFGWIVGKAIELYEREGKKVPDRSMNKINGDVTRSYEQEEDIFSDDPLTDPGYSILESNIFHNDLCEPH